MSEPIKHTRGPWIVNGSGASAFIITAKRGKETIEIADLIFVKNAPFVDTKAEVFRNAQLIAASPDLLAACEAALDVIPRYEPEPERLEVWHQLKAIIAKAKGEVAP